LRQAWDGKGAQIVAFRPTEGCSNGPTEAVSLLIQKVERVVVALGLCHTGTTGREAAVA
jgi:hypothetical protein